MISTASPNVSLEFSIEYTVLRMGKHLPTTILASYLVLKKDEKVLLARRQNTGYCDGQWSLPAGHVEAGETFTQALVREMEEELGIKLVSQDLKPVHMNHRKAEDGSERVNGFFVAEHWMGEVRNCEPEKCSELNWFPIHSLPKDTIAYIRERLNDMQAGTWYGEEGW